MEGSEELKKFVGELLEITYALELEIEELEDEYGRMETEGNEAEVGRIRGRIDGKGGALRQIEELLESEGWHDAELL